MRSKLILIALTTSLAACNTPGGSANRGVESVNVPVVTGNDYAFNAAAPNGALSAGDVERLNGWFRGLDLGYGDTVYVDGDYAPAARAQVAAVAGHYGILVSSGAPITAGALPPGSIRVIVARRRAEVPNCPNWSRPAAPDFGNRSLSNYGCAVNSNLAAMIADPEDLVHGREAGTTVDSRTATRAVDMYRAKPLTGAGGLQDVSTKSGGSK
jgi:pilus assembly protein CpaD